MSRHSASRFRRGLLVCAVVLAPLALAGDWAGGAALAPLLALATLAGMSERSRWVPLTAILAGGLSELLTTHSVLGAWITAAAGAGYAMSRLRKHILPEGMAGDFFCGLLCGLAGRLALLLFMRLAALPAGPGGGLSLLRGAPLDGLFTVLLARGWWRELR